MTLFLLCCYFEYMGDEPQFWCLEGEALHFPNSVLAPAAWSLQLLPLPATFFSANSANGLQGLLSGGCCLQFTKHTHTKKNACLGISFLD